jgi:prepilin-type N-terminal cleavage/methylation domain-containing protein
MKAKKGFTLIELMIVGAFAALLLIIFFVQKANVDAMDRDDDRKVAINAMYYALEEYYAPSHNGFYPSEISEDVLPVIDPELFTDPFGTNLGIDGSSYSYEPANCDESGQCREYILRAQLEKEDTYIKRGKR